MAELSISMDDSIPQQAGPGAGADKPFRVNLDREAATFLRDMIDAGEEPTEITLSLGYLRDDDGTVQYGLRVHETDYPEEGASLLVELPEPAHLAAPLAVEDSRERCASSPVVTYEQWRETAPWYQVMKPDPDEDRNSEPATIYRLANIAASQAWDAAMAAASSGKEN